MHRYHAGGAWTMLECPYFGYSVITTLDALRVINLLYGVS